MPILIADEVRKVYSGAGRDVEAVRGVSLTLEPGDFVAIMGPSGCGKSTLLHLCGGMDRPTSGRVLLDGIDLDAQDDDRLTQVRRERVGFVFQFFNLLPTLTLLENIALPLLLAGRAAAHDRARAAADRVGLGHRVGHYPAQLSGGELQRGAIARAVVHEPALVIADEPTGNLDTENGEAVLRLFMELNRERRLTILLATHAGEIGAAADRVIRLRDGRVDASPPQRRPALGTPRDPPAADPAKDGNDASL